MRERVWDEGYEVGYDDAIFDQRGLSTDSDADQYPHENPYRGLESADIDVAALRAAAEGATPGQWQTVYGEVVWINDTMIARADSQQDGRYIATASPVVVLALLDELEALRAAVRTHHEPTPQQWDAYASSVRDMPDPYRDEAAIRRALEAPPATPYIPPSLKRTLARNHEEQP